MMANLDAGNPIPAEILTVQLWNEPANFRGREPRQQAIHDSLPRGHHGGDGLGRSLSAGMVF